MFYVGVDLGQRRDHTAIVVVECVGHGIVVRHVVRVALGTPYPVIVERLGTIVRDRDLFGRVRLAVDGGGVGAPVIEMIGSAGLGCDVATAGSSARGNVRMGADGAGQHNDLVMALALAC